MCVNVLYLLLYIQVFYVCVFYSGFNKIPVFLHFTMFNITSFFSATDLYKRRFLQFPLHGHLILVSLTVF